MHDTAPLVTVEAAGRAAVERLAARKAMEEMPVQDLVVAKTRLASPGWNAKIRCVFANRDVADCLDMDRVEKGLADFVSA